MDVTGIELSGGFTSFLNAREIPVYESCEALAAARENAAFDLVMHFFVLEHVRDPVDFLRKALALVAPGGTMVFEIPCMNDPLLSIYHVPAFQRFYWSVAHNFYFTRQSIEFVLKQVSDDYAISNEQRYDLSNHMTWALEGKPGGQGKYSSLFTAELEKQYKESMIRTGYCDTLVCRIRR